jgi:hypothetical protein
VASTDSATERMLAAVDEPEPGWRPGDQLLVELPDGQTVRCRIVNLTDGGTIQVVPEHEVIIDHG